MEAKYKFERIKGRRYCMAEVRIDKNGNLSICGEAGTVTHAGRGRRYECGGQCWHELKEFFPELAEFEQWHLNDMRAGTPAQEAAIKQWTDAGNRYDYGAACDHLKTLGLYEVPATDEIRAAALGGFDGDTYKYGHRWLREPVPADVMDRLITFCESQSLPVPSEQEAA